MRMRLSKRSTSRDGNIVTLAPLVLDTDVVAEIYELLEAKDRHPRIVVRPRESPYEVPQREITPDEVEGIPAAQRARMRVVADSVGVEFADTIAPQAFADDDPILLQHLVNTLIDSGRLRFEWRRLAPLTLWGGVAVGAGAVLVFVGVIISSPLQVATG